VAIAVISALPAVYDAWKVVTIALDQLRGPAHGTDFLNLYAGAALLLRSPQDSYRFDAQLSLQRSLTEHPNLLVPFYLPPYAALLLSWLGWLPYGVAYLVWLIVGIGCVLLSAHWLAPRWTRASSFVWFGLGLLFLPVLLGLAQGQTSALMLLSVAAFMRGFIQRRAASTWLMVGLVGWALKPQFAPLVVCALLSARRWSALAWSAAILAALGGVTLLRLGQTGIADYTLASSRKMQEAFGEDPAFLLGPTLLHASHWFLGVTTAGQLVAAGLVVAALAAFVYVWRTGPARDDALLLQLAMLPIVSVLAAPYALIYELTLWLAAFWLLWRYTESRPVERSGLLWLTAGIWVAANLGVGYPLTGGADFAALFGLAAVAFIAWLFHVHVAMHADGSADVDPDDGVARQSDAYIPTA
jgi:hypothetical protein